MTQPIDLNHTPDSYGEPDPVAEIFGLLPDEEVRRRAWRLLAADDVGALEGLLREHRVLTRAGRFTSWVTRALGWDFVEHPAEWADDQEGICLASEQAIPDFYNHVLVRRVGWLWSFEGEFDGVRCHLGTSGAPVPLRRLIDMIESADVTQHFQQNGESPIWSSDFYPGLELHYAAEAEGWREGDGEVEPDGEA